jgi:hypothetical protein
MDDILKILLGALLSIDGGFLAEEAKKRRRLWSAARVLLHEFQRLWESADHRDPGVVEKSKSLWAAIESYKLALFEVDRAKFEEHWAVYRDLIRLLDSDREASHKQTLLLLDARRRLGALLGAEQLGAAELLGVPESGSPVSYGPTSFSDDLNENGAQRHHVGRMRRDRSWHHICFQQTSRLGRTTQVPAKRILAAIGFLGLGLAALVGMTLIYLEQRARSLSLDSIVALASKTTLPSCKPLISVELPRHVMAEGESQVLAVTLENTATESCEVRAMINAANFVVQPSEEFRTSVPPVGKGTTQLAWSIAPQTKGEQQLVISIASGLEARQARVSILVTDVWGFKPRVAQFFSLLGVVMGPMLTVPYWYEKWRSREERRKAQPRGRADGNRKQRGSRSLTF